MSHRLVLVLLLFAASLVPSSSRAQWAADGNLVSAGVSNQLGASAAPDGAGGVFVTWADTRSGNSDVYAQHLDAQGAVQWVANGVAVRSASANQSSPRIAADGAGGAIIVWIDDKSGSTNIYAQRIDATGAAWWDVNGVSICNAPQNQESISVIPDGAGGAIVAWQDARAGSFMVADIYAQRINAGGSVQWASDGVAVCTATDQQSAPTLTSDGAGGAIVAWSDNRSGTSRDIYAQRISGAGAAQWAPDGVPLCTQASEQDASAIAGDGAGGAIVTWIDGRNGFTDVFVQRVSALGTPQWTADGVALCTAANAQNDPQVVSDGAGGAIVTWNDARFMATSDVDLFAQRVDGSGLPQWAADGVELCVHSGTQLFARPIADGAGGVVVTWMDTRAGGLNYDIYAQRLNGAGAVQWTAGGVPLCTAGNGQLSPTVASDGFGGAIVAWDDYRSGSTSDIYANRVIASGAIATAVERTPGARPVVLSAGYPNPFSTGAFLDLALPRDADVRVEVFDAAGRRVRALDLGHRPAGASSFAFDGRDDAGRRLPSGVYFCRVQAAGETFRRRLVIQR